MQKGRTTPTPIKEVSEVRPERHISCETGSFPRAPLLYFDRSRLSPYNSCVRLPKTKPSKVERSAHQSPLFAPTPAVCRTVSGVSDPTGERAATPDTNAAKCRYHRVLLGCLELRNLFHGNKLPYFTRYCQQNFTPHLHQIYTGLCYCGTQLRISHFSRTFYKTIQTTAYLLRSLTAYGSLHPQSLNAFLIPHLPSGYHRPYLHESIRCNLHNFR